MGELIHQAELAGGEIEFSVYREGADEEPRVRVTAPEGNPPGFTFAALPEPLQRVLRQLQPGDSIAFRLSRSGKGWTFANLDRYPEYFEPIDVDSN